MMRFRPVCILQLRSGGSLFCYTAQYRPGAFDGTADKYHKRYAPQPSGDGLNLSLSTARQRAVTPALIAPRLICDRLPMANEIDTCMHRDNTPHINTISEARSSLY